MSQTPSLGTLLYDQNTSHTLTCHTYDNGAVRETKQSLHIMWQSYYYTIYMSTSIVVKLLKCHVTVMWLTCLTTTFPGCDNHTITTNNTHTVNITILKNGIKRQFIPKYHQPADNVGVYNPPFSVLHVTQAATVYNQHMTTHVRTIYEYFRWVALFWNPPINLHIVLNLWLRGYLTWKRTCDL